MLIFDLLHKVMDKIFACFQDDVNHLCMNKFLIPLLFSLFSADFVLANDEVAGSGQFFTNPTLQAAEKGPFLQHMICTVKSGKAIGYVFGEKVDVFYDDSGSQSEVVGDLFVTFAYDFFEGSEVTSVAQKPLNVKIYKPDGEVLISIVAHAYSDSYNSKSPSWLSFAGVDGRFLRLERTDFNKWQGGMGYFSTQKQHVEQILWYSGLDCTKAD